MHMRKDKGAYALCLAISFLRVKKVILYEIFTIKKLHNNEKINK